MAARGASSWSGISVLGRTVPASPVTPGCRGDGGIIAAGGRMVACGADVSKDAGAQSLVDAALDSFGKVDAVINNTEIVRTADFLDVPVEGHQRIWMCTTRHAEAAPRRVATSKSRPRWEGLTTLSLRRCL
ncbi:hypothetical protein J7E69_24850 [Rhodococcus enclensis]|nr:hypothetical protein [Rhodococcus qingshengii]